MKRTRRCETLPKDEFWQRLFADPVHRCQPLNQHMPVQAFAEGDRQTVHQVCRREKLRTRDSPDGSRRGAESLRSVVGVAGWKSRPGVAGSNMTGNLSVKNVGEFMPASMDADAATVLSIAVFSGTDVIAACVLENLPALCKDKATLPIRVLVSESAPPIERATEFMCVPSDSNVGDDWQSVMASPGVEVSAPWRLRSPIAIRKRSTKLALTLVARAGLASSITVGPVDVVPLT